MNNEYLQPADWQFADEITRGVEYLNERDPLWYLKVDLDRLDMNKKSRDVLTLSGIHGPHHDITLGFPPARDAYAQQLTREWRQVIKSLRTRPALDTLPSGAKILMQNDDGRWFAGTFNNARSDSSGGWTGEPSSFDHHWHRIETAPAPEIPNPAWRATLTYLNDSIKEQDTMTITTQDAYKALFEDFKARVPVGSTVRLVRHWTNEDASRWGSDRLTGTMRDHFPVGTEMEIQYYIGLNAYYDGWAFPITCLEVVKAKPAYQTVRLNDQYSAEVYKDKITVGCQTFDADVVGKLIEALTELRR